MGEVWTTFLLRNIEIGLLRKLKKDAKRERRSLSDLIRSILCDRYSLDCPPSGTETRLPKYGGSTTQLLKLHPHLFQTIKIDSQMREVSMRSIILEALESRYVTDIEEVA